MAAGGPGGHMVTAPGLVEGASGSLLVSVTLLYQKMEASTASAGELAFARAILG